MNTRIPRQAEDLIIKAILHVLKNGTLKPLNLDVPRVVDLVPTEIPIVEVSRNELDLVFLLEDDTYLHLEVQSSKTDLHRFLLYDVRLMHRDQKPIRTVVLYTGGIQEAPDRISGGSVQYRVQNVYLASFDGDAERQRIRSIVENEHRLSPEDQVELVFSIPPWGFRSVILMRNTGGIYQATMEAMDLAEQIEEPLTRDFLLGCFVGLSDKFLTGDERETVRERMRMSLMVQELLEEEHVKGLAEGLAKGLAIARENVLVVFEARFSSVPEQVRLRVLSTEDLELLNSWLKAIICSGSSEDAERIVLG